MPASSREKFCHLLLDVRCLSCNFLIFKNKIVLWKKKNNLVWSFIIIPHFLLWASISSLSIQGLILPDPVSVPIKYLWIWSAAFESSDIHEWFWNIAVFLFKDSWSIGCLSNTYHWGLVESEDIFPMKITPFQSSWASKHWNEKRNCVNAEYDWVCSEEISYTEIHKSELHRPKDCIAIGNWEHYGSARILRSYSTFWVE